MFHLDCSIEELIERHKRGEQLFIASPAKIPSADFPAGSSPTIRMYSGRTETSWGTLRAEVQGSVTERGLTVPSSQLKGLVNPATGQVIPTRISLWLVRPEGIEQYAGLQGEITQDGPPSLDSLLTKNEDYTN
jgi:hypothetical protein